VLPLEFQFLNKKAFLDLGGQLPHAVKHFEVRRKPRAAALRSGVNFTKNLLAAFLYKVFFSNYSYAGLSYFFDKKCAKAAYKMLVNLSSGVDFVNFLLQIQNLCAQSLFLARGYYIAMLSFTNKVMPTRIN